MPVPDCAADAEPDARQTPSPPLLSSSWQVRLLGAVEIRCGDLRENRFANRAVALLLARLASQPLRTHAREQLIELLWPGISPSVGRARFRPVLSALRSLLEPPGWRPGCVLIADRLTVRCRPQALGCDVVEFEALARAGRWTEARRAYGGEFMPGYYDDWVAEERGRLAAWLDAAPVEPSCDAPEVARSSLDGPVASLPVAMGGFFGRSQEKSDLRQGLKARRLITVTGMGGCGKTRLAVEVARAEQAERCVAFVPLAECSDAHDVIEHVRASLQLPRGDARNAEQLLRQIADALDGRDTLLVIDNYEQLVGAAGSAVMLSLLDRLPNAKLLVTSRRALQLPGELEFALMPLPVPASDASLADMASNPCVALFIERARDVQRRFQIGERNAADITRLCRVLEGLPLSLELAAAKVRAYSVAEMSDALQDSRDLLARRRQHTAPVHRHDSLNAAIDWSWQLLEAPLRRMAVALTVFRGGWTAAQAAVVADAPLAHALLEELVAESLIHAVPDEAGGPTRFSMLETVRVHARAKLSSEEAALFRKRHRALFADQAVARGNFDTLGPGIDLPNHVAAVESALDDADADQALALALSLRPFLHACAPTPSLRELLRRVAREAPPSTPGYGALLCLLARLLVASADVDEARDCATRALVQAGSDPAQRAQALHCLARIDWMISRDGDKVDRLSQEALSLARRAGQRHVEADCLALLAAVQLLGRRSAPSAQLLFQQAEALHRESGDASAAMVDRDGQISCLMLNKDIGGGPRGKLAAARKATAMALACAREAEEAGLRDARILLLSHAGYGHVLAGQHAEALAIEQLIVRLTRNQHLAYYLSAALWNQCISLARLRRPLDAARMMAFSQRYWTERFGPIAPADMRLVERVRRLVVVQAGHENWHRCWNEGLAWPLGVGLAAGSGLAEQR